MSAKYSKFGKLLSQLRTDAGIERQAQLADMLQVTQQTVSRWEAGESRPRAGQVSEIAAMLRADPNDLLQSAGYTTVNSTLSFDRPFPVDALSEESFERFTQMLVELVYSDAQVNGYGATGHKQNGLDVLATFPDGRRYSFQCKRAANFGPSKVREAVGEHTAQADKKFIVLSRIASPQAREEVAKHQDWALWDKEDISRRIRLLGTSEQKRLVRVFFREHEIALLGESAASPWESLEEFFAPFDDSRLLFNHKWELIGRDAELKELSAQLDDTALPVLFLVGSGGSGKSRLLKQTLEEHRQARPSVRIYFIARDGELTRQSIEELGEGRLLLVVDDAHDRSDLHCLFEYASVNRDRARLVIATRPYGYERHRMSALRFSLIDSSMPAVTLKPLTMNDAETLAARALASSGWTGSRDVAKQIARLTLDCPLATVVAARIISAEPKNVALVGHEDQFRAAIFKQFETVAAGHIGRPDDAPQLSALLSFIALIQPISINDDRTWTVYASFAGIPEHEVKRHLDTLTRSGVLFRRGQTYRLSPDVLADYLIEDRCVAFGGSSTGYAERVFDLVHDHVKAKLLVNLARLDWRRSSGDVAESRLLDGVWAKLNPSDDPWDTQLNAVADIAYYQPKRCLAFVERKIAEGSRSTKLARICKYAAYNMAYLDQAPELLWELGKVEPESPKSDGDSAIQVLKELAVPEPRKPLAYIEAVVEFGLRLATQQDAWRYLVSPFDLLVPVFQTQGHLADSNGKQVEFQAHFVNPDRLRPIRERVLDLVFSLLVDADPIVASKAAQTLSRALDLPSGLLGVKPKKEYREQWAAQHSATLKRLLKLAKSETLYPAVQLELERALAWQAGHGPQQLSKLAREVIGSFSFSLEERTDRALSDGYGMRARMMAREDGEAKWNDMLDKLKAELLEKFPDRALLVKFLESRMQGLNQGSRWNRGDAYALMNKLMTADVTFCEAVIGKAWIDSESVIAGYAADGLCHLLIYSPSSYRNSIADFAGSPLTSHQVIAADAIGFRLYNQENTERGDIELLKSLLHHQSENIVLRALRALRQLLSIDAEAVKEIILTMPLKSEQIASDVAVLFVPEEGLSVDVFSDAELNCLLNEFKNLPDVGEHWIQQLFATLSRRTPHIVLRFFIERIEAASTQRKNDEEYRAVNYGPWLRKRLAFRKSPHAKELIFEFINWWKGAANDVWLLDYNARTAFEAMFGPYDDEIIAIIDEWAERAQPEDFDYIASILREADDQFVFRYPNFLLKLLDRARQFGSRTKKMVISELFCSAINGMRSGLVGEPFPQDIALKAAAEEALAKCPPNTPLSELYERILKHADAEIRRHSEWEDE